jgi:hypothetical protein
LKISERRLASPPAHSLIGMSRHRLYASSIFSVIATQKIFSAGISTFNKASSAAVARQSQAANGRQL